VGAAGEACPRPIAGPLCRVQASAARGGRDTSGRAPPCQPRRVLGAIGQSSAGARPEPVDRPSRTLISPKQIVIPHRPSLVECETRSVVVDFARIRRAVVSDPSDRSARVGSTPLPRDRARARRSASGCPARHTRFAPNELWLYANCMSFLRMSPCSLHLRAFRDSFLHLTLLVIPELGY
jgi:hypothetical protein